jgi:hypothetical protein
VDVSLTVRDTCRLRIFVNRMLRRISEPKREEVTGSRKMHNEELRNLCSSPNITRMTKSIRVLASAVHILKIGKNYQVNELGRACSTHGREEKFM